MIKTKSEIEQRRWIREVNELGKQRGYKELAGTPDHPESDMLDLFKRGQTPEQAIATCFGSTN